MRYAIALFLMLPFVSVAQDYSGLIEIQKFDKAWKKCQKVLKKNPESLEEIYFSAVIQSRTLAGNLFNPIEAQEQCKKALQIYKGLSDIGKLEKLDEIPINLKAFRILNDSISKGGLLQAKQINSEQGYIDYLAVFSSITDADVKFAVSERNRLAFVSAKIENTELSFQKFIDKYPQAIEVSESKALRNQVAFSTANALNSIEGYDDFLRKYPEANERNLALSKRNALAFQQAKEKNTIEAFEYFIQKYPDAVEVLDAHELIHGIAFDLAKKSNKSSDYKFYFTKYPNSKQCSEAKELFEMTEFKESTTVGTWETYRDFFESHSSRYNQVAIDSILSISRSTQNPKPLLFCIDHVRENENLVFEYYNLISKDGELNTLINFQNRFPLFATKISKFLSDFEYAQLASELGLTIENPSVSINSEMEKRLKREGAKSGAITISLMWDNYNDIDLHCVDPNGEEIFFGHKQSRSGGELDVDMNAGGPMSNEPVENIFWQNNKALKGKYKVYINHYFNHGCSECIDPTNYTLIIRYNNIVKEFKGKITFGEPKRMIYEFNYSNNNFGEIEINETIKSKLSTYMFYAGDNELSFVALQKYISLELQAEKWALALNEMNKFDMIFKDNLKFQNLKSVLKNNSQNDIEIKEIQRINSLVGEEYSPVISGNSKSLYFCGSNRPDSLGGEDVYVSHFVDRNWSSPSILSGLSDASSNEAIMAVTMDESKVLLFNNGMLGYSEKLNLGWSEIEYFSNEINDGIWNGDAMISSDGNALIFASVRLNDGFGNDFNHNAFYHSTNNYFSDIYVSLRKNDSWTSPINLGSRINTKYIERSPFLHPDMKTLYFSSDGHGGLGKMDVFMTTRLADTCWDCWSEPVNLGREINSIQDDWGYRISTEGDLAYFSKKITQNRSDDIFTFTLPKNLRPDYVAKIEGELKNSKNEPIATTIRWEDLEADKVIGIAKTDPSDGSYFIALPLGKNYGYYVEDTTYFPVSNNLDLRNVTTQIEVNNNIQVITFQEMIDQGIAVSMNNLFFAFGKYFVLPASYPELKRIAKIIERYDLKVEIDGHTDDVGNDESNLILSDKRAAAVKEYLVRIGCKEEMLITHGYGESKPLHPNDNDANRAKNRRVELRLIK
jgi:outer membrane protein OmpA-like peptidoglycan-associated protein